MSEALDQYLKSEPEIVFEWKDKYTSAQGWLVINSLLNGGAGGGTRMRKGLNKQEVISLAKVMGIKFSVCGPAIGGAKSGIDFDPHDPRKQDVLRRWFTAIRPLLKSYYGTGGDLNVDEVKDVFPITESLGIIHPQEGVLTGHFGYEDKKKVEILDQLDRGCKLPVLSNEFSVDRVGKYNVADMITGFGVAESVRHFYEIFYKKGLEGQKCLIQGWGNVASAAAFYLAKNGALISGIMDREYGIWDQNGLGLEEIRKLFMEKDGNQLKSPDMIPMTSVSSKLWNEAYDIFIPAAASRIVDINESKLLIDNGLKLISCGANVPFAEDKIIYGNTSQWLDQRISLIPDFIANCGMARTFCYLMNENCQVEEHAIFSDVSEIIKSCILMLYRNSTEPTNIMHNALNQYLKN